MPASKPFAPARLAGVMFLCIFAIALTGLFGIWYSHEQSHQALDRLSALTRLIDSARQAQVEFKIQVQDWKNLLLRGQNAEDFANYSKRFADQDRLVQFALAAVRDSATLPAELRDEAASLATDHATLLPKYQSAAAAYSSTDPSTIFTVDQSVRGIDQKLNARIDALARQLSEKETALLDETRLAGEQLYKKLRIAMGAVSLIAVCCATALAWRARSAIR
jgi:hypothetical protein